LIKICKNKLISTEKDVNKILDELEETSTNSVEAET